MPIIPVRVVLLTTLLHWSECEDAGLNAFGHLLGRMSVVLALGLGVVDVC